MTWMRRLPPSGGGAAAMKPEKLIFKPGWRRTLAEASVRPVTLPPAPWETETEKESDERYSAPRG